MNCAKFQKTYSLYTNFPNADSNSYSDWIDHRWDCHACSEWFLEQVVIGLGHSLADFPCVHVAYYSTITCEMHRNNVWKCPDITLYFNPERNEYGIPVRDGTTSYIAIMFCPWCGKSLASDENERGGLRRSLAPTTENDDNDESP